MLIPHTGDSMSTTKFTQKLSKWTLPNTDFLLKILYLKGVVVKEWLIVEQ